MRKTIIFAASVILFASCNDSFMEKYPTDAISELNFWHNANELEIYCNTFYTQLEGHGNNEFYASKYCVGDEQSDNMVPQVLNDIAAGKNIVPTSSNSEEWNWSLIRSLNYFLSRYNKTPIAQATKDIYAGEVKFFKSMEYFDKVKRYGDVPWLSKDLKIDSPELFKARDSRIMVMDSVLNDINWAISKLPFKANAKGRINSDMALHLKARICLHEGTFRKYHGIKGSEKFLQEAVSASSTLMVGGKYQLNDTNNPAVDYRNNFCSLDLSANKEMIFFRPYIEAVITTHTSSSVEGNDYNTSISKSLVESYLCTDGKPISQSPLYKGDGSLQFETTDRDPRLTQTICAPGQLLLRKTIMPNIPGAGLGGGNCPTGYQMVKYWVDDPAEYARKQKGLLDCPIFRYAEILLINAEANAELGSCTQATIDATINKLRDRAGMPNMIISNLVKDVKSDFPTISVLLDEIRRERRVELAIENFRYDDLMRWKAGKLLEKPIRGMKFVQSQYPKVVVGKNIYLDANGYINPYQTVLPNGRQFDESKQYYFPLPTEELVLNPALTQNPGYTQ